ncbi:toxin-antitoxin system YwqK family antitoxin [Paenimyroides aestuarii]|uniref:Toxin-antitoxin system YwqK family antitoxin n=1 Tax=Paenimyroides aestuarii TaxID=2968490 RepID=A0ABY5NVP4_9FLAO|nr:toxin-antitoxin system YwqK family antitoxin [Paenimyroides aestuarii]UUV22670.1 hypothetical protein NPX36_06410 [Paenimyroides aestuarii]
MMNLFRYNILFLLTVYILIGCSKADINDESKRNENWAYWIDEDSGKASWIPVTDETTVENGVYHLFYTNGKLFEKGRLKNKVHVDTVFKYNEMGDVIKYSIHQKDTILHVYLKDGDYIEKYQNGKIYQNGKLTNGTFNDNWERYYKNGQTEFIQDFINGNGAITWFFENGNVSSLSYRLNGKTEGKVQHWFKNGNLDEVSYWKNGLQDSLFTYFYENGQMQGRSNFKEGKKQGKSEVWHENGQLKLESFYVDDILHGSFKQWKDNGKLEVDGNYINGQLKSKIYGYHKNGKISTKGNLIDKTPEGIWEIFDESGKLIKKRYFENGNLIKEEKF